MNDQRLSRMLRSLADIAVRDEANQVRPDSKAAGMEKPEAYSLEYEYVEDFFRPRTTQMVQIIRRSRTVNFGRLLRAREYHQPELAGIIRTTSAVNADTDTLLGRAVSLHANALSRRIVMKNVGQDDGRYRFPAHDPHETMTVETVS